MSYHAKTPKGRMYMATSQYPRRTSGTFTINRQASQVINHGSAMSVVTIRYQKAHYMEQ